MRITGRSYSTSALRSLEAAKVENDGCSARGILVVLVLALHISRQQSEVLGEFAARTPAVVQHFSSSNLRGELYFVLLLGFNWFLGVPVLHWIPDLALGRNRQRQKTAGILREICSIVSSCFEKPRHFGGGVFLLVEL